MEAAKVSILFFVTKISGGTTRVASRAAWYGRPDPAQFFAEPVIVSAFFVDDGNRPAIPTEPNLSTRISCSLYVRQSCDSLSAEKPVCDEVVIPDNYMPAV